MQDRILDGRYRLGRQLGAGGSGTVWEALDLRLERQVAVKVVGTVTVGRDPRARERFEREAKLLASLSSPFIVTVHDVGEARFDGDPDSVLYLVMERLPGRSLDQLLAEERALPPLGEVARWGEHICRALAVAHESGVVHRDLKPANVMVGPDGLARVLDFGIAAVLAESTDHARLTSTGVVVGTPAYMSPEQIEGGAVGLGSDLYSAGCVLYALVTGRPPFHGTSLYQLLRQQMESAPRTPGELRPGLPREWDELILAMLAKRPGDRPGGAAEVADRLREMSVFAARLPPAPLAATLAYQPTRVDSRPDPRAVVLASCPRPDGGRLPLATGQRMRLADVLPGANAFTVGLDWRAPEGMDADASALVVGADGRVLSDEHFVFYNNPEPAGVALRLAADGPEAMFWVKPVALRPGAARVVFALSIHDAEARGQELSAVRLLHARLVDPGSGEELLCFGFPAGPPGASGVTFGELVREDDGWWFGAVSRPYTGGLAGIAEAHGVAVS
ncbi:protein kinase domain-containing protein [Streptomyces litchfieldiae]|uniref:non-specific serine/threonine protein kinase n=1 Tax=Streptomyces litchfieldiae TaxID=3075543 RepID=A0ABU2MYE3_9ACTN|nr:TerD family protein [Streptomyces sp. DSM 44938]MDT0346667.1 TerD family protein [Streptomyces sp. DSM 44938]